MDAASTPVGSGRDRQVSFFGQ